MYTTMLELAISMAFLFLMLSAASSAIQEIIANIFRWRAKTLEKGIGGLLRSEKVKNELYQLPLLQGLFSPNARGQLAHKPSYIPSSTFALAVLHWAEQTGLNLPGSSVVPASNPPPTASAQVDKTTLLLQSLLRGAKDVEEQKKRLEDWFDNSMNRISGWYKRSSHAALWIIGILLCLLVNADSISLANVFWNDQALRAAIVTAATEHVKSAPKEERTSPTTSSSPPTTAGGGAAAGQTMKPDDTAFKRLKDVKAELAKVNIPLGWCWYTDENQKEKKCFPEFSPVRLTVKGNSGNKTYYYWIVANHTDGRSSLSGPFSVSNAPDKPTDKDYIALSWQAEPEAKGYDILRTLTNELPAGKCDCAVAMEVSGLTTSDKAASLQPYNAGNILRTGDADIRDPRLVPPLGFELFLKLLGIALTALAISQGAPFWFDLLQKAVNLRLAGDAPDEKQKKK